MRIQSDGWSFSVYAQQEVSLLIGIVGGGHQQVLARCELVSSGHLAHVHVVHPRVRLVALEVAHVQGTVWQSVRASV